LPDWFLDYAEVICFFQPRLVVVFLNSSIPFEGGNFSASISANSIDGDHLGTDPASQLITILLDFCHLLHSL